MITATLDSHRSFFLVFDKGDDVLAVLTEFAKTHSVRGATFIALGAFRDATVAWWNPESKEYEHIELAEQAEVLTMTGNIGVDDSGRPKIHAHVVLGRRYGSTIAGHLLKATVFPTIEMHVVDCGKTIVRSTDAETRLALISRIE